MPDTDRPPATANVAPPAPAAPEQEPSADEPADAAEAVPVAQEQPPSFAYGSSAAGTARDGVEPGPVAGDDAGDDAGDPPQR